MLAAANNHLNCVKELLKQGADPAARRLVSHFYLLSEEYFFFVPFRLQTGTCALFFAAQGGFLEIVKELLAHGAPVDLPSYVS